MLKHVKLHLNSLAPLLSFRTRAGESLNYRLYPSWSENLVVFYHGVLGDSRYLSRLAQSVAEQGLATVVTPDFRGHGLGGEAPVLGKLTQLEEDFEELLVHLRFKLSVRNTVVAGHSLGGSLCLRLSQSSGANWYAGFLAVAPYLPFVTGALRPEFQQWIREEGENIHLMWPDSWRLGHETLKYHRSFFSAALPDPKKNFPPNARLMLAGNDELFDSQSLGLWAKNQNLECFVSETATHFSVATEGECLKTIAREIARFFR
ncbi:MAG: alpha/beta fold hydrolase [Bdellovibrionaceae bacterium]|nr:alpha/beta fold hydrolase [Pseudobdellovibrionaceae bacterium]